jgi:hyperosmotically inducible periplasmic protein
LERLTDKLPEESLRKTLNCAFATALFVAALGGAAISRATPMQKSKNQGEPKSEKELAGEVRHQLAMLPFYSVFDHLTFSVEGNVVTLEGQVVRTTLKSDAESAVKSIRGVAAVVNNIEVLPVSPADDTLRRAVYRTIYGDTVLCKYAYLAVPSIHIIVKNGNVTLEGVVDSDSDRNLANLRASQVPNVFSVKNNLAVAGSEDK